MTSQFLLKKISIVYDDNTMDEFHSPENDGIYAKYIIDGLREKINLSRNNIVSANGTPTSSILKKVHGTIIKNLTKITCINVECNPSIILSLGINKEDGVYSIYDMGAQSNNPNQVMECVYISGSLIA